METATAAKPLNLAEFTLKVFVLGVILTFVLAAANAYLALKIGILTSASIPAAVLSMGILHFFSRASILEHNLVQTAASAGQAIAGGVVYTIPALIIIGYWTHFDYWTSVWVALLGGLLGVLFSVPLRRVLVHLPRLPFPEGHAIAQVLKAGDEAHLGLRSILMGGVIGAGLEALQTGFKLLASEAQLWVLKAKTAFGFGLGFSPAMIGAGYIIGPRICLSIFVGAILSWLLGVPLAGYLTHTAFTETNLSAQVGGLWSDNLRYVGIGAMLTSAIFTLARIVKPVIDSMRFSLQAVRGGVKQSQQHMSRTERDLPLPYVGLAILVCLGFLGWFFYQDFPLISQHMVAHPVLFVFLCVVYVLILGFILSALTGYFSGLVGVAATPGSAVVVAGLVFAALMIRSMLAAGVPALTPDLLKAGAAVTIFLGAMITGAAAIALDTIQDLKVGQLVGSTPWRQQMMLMIGVVCSALIIPPVMELLFNVYGIAGVVPRPEMDVAATLPAPPAALMAAVIQSVFEYEMPWHLFGIGALVVLVLTGINEITKRHNLEFSVLAIAVGMYLPLASSMPLAIGGAFAWFADRKLHKHTLTAPVKAQRKRRGLVVACGLVAGAALMEIVLAIPFVLMSGPESLRLVSLSFTPIAVTLSFLSVAGLGIWFYKMSAK